MDNRPPVIHRLPGTPALAWRALRPKGRSGDGEILPEVHLNGLRADPELLAGYRELCGLPTGDHLPLTYLFVLAFRAQVTLLTHPGFPLPALGMIHRSNRFERLTDQPLEVAGPLDLKVRVSRAETVEKGREVTVESLFTRAGERSDRPLARSISQQFARGRGHGRPSAKGPRFGPPDGDGASWRLGSDLGRRYAAVSGDHNPIHLYSWSARLLGFRRPIAHGMYLAARALAAIEARNNDPSSSWRSMDVRFKTPTFLPGEPRFFVVGSRRDGVDAELWSSDLQRPHMSVSLNR